MSARIIIGSLPTALLSLAAVGLPIYGCVRTFTAALSTCSNDDEQWLEVSKHEQRFIQALKMGTASEADDASC